MNDLDQATLQFSAENLFVVNLSLGFIMFGVALSLTITDFKSLLSHPKPVLVGLFSQFVALPAVTLALILLIRPQASIALGMILVAACPGGNISNFMSILARGNGALSISLTAVASIAAVVMTPFNIEIWGGMYGPAAEILRSVSLDFIGVVKIIGMILIIPMILGMLVRHFKPRWADKIRPITHYGSILIFGAIVVLAFKANIDLFLQYVSVIIGLVFVHNALAYITGFGVASGFKLSRRDRRTLSIETGIQNSGLGLGLIFTFFDGLGGMAIVAGWWGIWHIISGLAVAHFFKRIATDPS